MLFFPFRGNAIAVCKKKSGNSEKRSALVAIGKYVRIISQVNDPRLKAWAS